MIFCKTREQPPQILLWLRRWVTWNVSDTRFSDWAPAAGTAARSVTGLPRHCRGFTGADSPTDVC